MTTELNQVEIKQAEIEEEYPEPKGNLTPYLKHYGRTREEQIKINLAGIKMLKEWNKEELTEDELKKAEETWEMVKQIIDENRSRKFFS